MKRIKVWFIAVVMICISVLGCGNAAYAASNNYSNVLDDLKIDKEFNVADYPVDETDYSLQVIQIAESIDNELMLYVYQPAKSFNFVATSISMSTTIGDNFSPQLHKLTFLNSNGVFSKYKVKDFTIKKDAVRYYEIVEIFRKWNAMVDVGVGGDNTIDEVSYAVGVQFTACTLNGEVTYSAVDIEVIEITSKHVGFLRYLNGFFLFANSCDAHYVAFSTDKKIDKLIEADVSYVSKTFTETKSILGTRKTFGNEVSDVKSVKYSEKAENELNGIWGNKYIWDRIQTVEDFVAKENLTDKSELAGKQWVLRFLETDFHSSPYVNGMHTESGTEVSQVSILRLKFETDGKIYNLGVVDNKQTGSNVPDNVKPPIDKIPWWVWAILGGLALIIIGFVVKPVAEILLWVVKVVVSIITLPFKLIGLLFKQRK